MKKLFVVALIIPMAFLFVGCGNVVATVYRLGDGRVVQIVQMNFDAEERPSPYQIAEVVGFFQGDDSPFWLGGTNRIRRESGVLRFYKPTPEGEERDPYFSYGKEVLVSYTATALAVRLVFDNFYSYAHFNEMEVVKDKAEIVRGFFFVEHTRIMQNPFRSFFEEGGNRTRELIEWLSVRFDGEMEDLVLAYIHRSSVRLTASGTNADEVRRTEDGWEYVFITQPGEPIEDIVLFIRDANRAVWYGVGVVATLAFGLILLGVLKFLRKGDRIGS